MLYFSEIRRGDVKEERKDRENETEKTGRTRKKETKIRNGNVQKT